MSHELEVDTVWHLIQYEISFLTWLDDYLCVCHNYIFSEHVVVSEALSI